MNPHSDEMALLRAADPAPVQPDRGRTEVAAAALARILEDPADPSTAALGDARGRHRVRILGWSSRRLMLVLAPVLVAGGAAFAATDPLGWWSTNPTYAKYGASLSKHVRTPSARTLTCTTSAGLRCVPASWQPGSTVPLANGRRSTAQPYEFATAVSPPGHGISRRALVAYVARRRAVGKLSAANTAQFRAAIAAVPNSFFTQFDANLRYSTFGSGGATRHGLEQVPPAGVPAQIVCEPAGSGLTCQNLNGDQHAPIGAGIYGAVPTKRWRYARVPPENWNLPPGVSYTHAEYRLLIDMLRFATVTHSVSSVGTTTVSPRTVSTPAAGNG
jgi:hypothetical protein